MKRAWPLIAASLGLSLAACWNFESAYQDCLSTGRCSGGGGGDGGDGGDGGGDGGGDSGVATCPPGSPTGNGLCLVQMYRTGWAVYGLYGASSSDIVVGGRDENFYTVRQGVLAPDNAYLGNYSLLADLDGLSGSDVWAAGTIAYAGASLYHYDGLNWTNPSAAAQDLGDCNGVWEEDAGYAFAACEIGLQRITTTGQAPTLIDNTASGELFYGVWGVWNGPAWVVGYDPGQSKALIRQRSGATWSPQLFPAGKLRAIHGTSDHDAWAVGDSSALLHLDDAGWHSVSTTAVADFNDVYVDRSGEAWITTFDTRVMVASPDGGQRVFSPPGILSIPEEIILQRVQTFPTGDVWLTATTWDGGYFGGLVLHYQRP